MKTKYREHSLFFIYRERRTHGKKRFRYGLGLPFGRYNRFNTDNHALAQAMTQAGYELKNMEQPTFRFQNRETADRFYTIMTLILGA